MGTSDPNNMKAQDHFSGRHANYYLVCSPQHARATELPEMKQTGMSQGGSSSSKSLSAVNKTRYTFGKRWVFEAHRRTHEHRKLQRDAGVFIQNHRRFNHSRDGFENPSGGHV